MKDIFIGQNSSIRDALQKLSFAGEKSLIILNLDDKKILGTLSDGDIRKAILKGKEINDSIIDIYKKDFLYLLKNNIDKIKVKELFLKHRIDIIPIINQNNEVKDVLVWSEFFNKEKIKHDLDLPVVIMAGGKGVRLEPFTKILPKPLIPINGKPIIEYIIEKFLDYGIKEYYLSVNYKSRILKAYFEESDKEYQTKFIEENSPLGTAGSLKLLKDKINKPFFVTNCDMIIDVNLNDFYNFHKANNNIISFVTSKKKQIIPYGICNLDENGKFDNITEKHYSTFFVNVGLYLVDPKILEIIPSNDQYHMTDLINKCKENGHNIGIFPIIEDSWLDIGQWSEYKKTVSKLEV